MMNDRVETRSAGEKNLSLEGLRGIASMMVVLSHLAFTFSPGLHGMGPPRGRWDGLLSNSPLSFFYSGNFSVCVFFVMSGYVLTAKFERTGHEQTIRDLFVKRYFRLAPPVLVSTLVGFVLLSAGVLDTRGLPLSGWITGMFQFRPSFRDALTEGIWRGFLLGSASYDPPAWSMRVEFLGSMLVFALALLTRGSALRWMTYLVTITALLFTQGNDGPYFAVLVVGALIAQMPRIRLGARGAAGLLVLGVWLGGYHPGSTFHRPLALLGVRSVGLDALYVVHALAGVMIFAAVLWTPQVSSLLARFGKLGKRSFSIYLIHFFVLCWPGTWLFMRCYASWGLPYGAAAAVASAGVLVGSYVVAGVFERWVDAPSIALAGTVARRMGRVGTASTGGVDEPRAV